jgi:hypothetical protein
MNFNQIYNKSTKQKWNQIHKRNQLGIIFGIERVHIISYA